MGKTLRSQRITPAPLRASVALDHLKIPRTPGVRNRPFLVALARAVASFADHDTGAGARPALDTLAERVQASRRSVQRGLARLQALGILRKAKAHSWRLHRPTEWAVEARVLASARRQVLEQVRQRSARYWERLRSWSRRSGGQHVSLPSPLQGERVGSRTERAVGPPRLPGSSPLLAILSNLQSV